MRPISFSYAPLPASGNTAVVCALQTIAGAGNLLINGSKASGGVATLPGQQYLLFTTTEDDTGVTATITGTDAGGNVIGEAVVLVSSSTVASTKSYKTVTQIAVSGAIAANISVGVNGLGYSQPYPLDVYLTPFEVSVSVDGSGQATYKAQYTYDNVWASTWPNGTQNWVDSASMTGKTAAFVDSVTAPVTAVRFAITTAHSAQVVAGTIVQAGGGL